MCKDVICDVNSLKEGFIKLLSRQEVLGLISSIREKEREKERREEGTDLYGSKVWIFN
jgi:hypothetical protein